MRLELERLFVMVERVCPIAELLVVVFLRFAVLIKRVTEIVMALALQTGISREQGLTERFQRFIVIL